jgi:hypothetical protein
VNTYQLADTITLSTTFKVANVLTDPATVTLVVEAPDGTQQTYTYAGAQITKDSVGTYHKDYGPAAQTGVYSYQWTGTGPASGVEQGQFTVTDLLSAPTVNAARASMAALVLRVRTLINDPASGTQQFTDRELQDWLDENRRDVRYLELTPEWQTTGTLTQWLNYYDNLYGGCWETDAAFVNGSWVAKTPDTSDWLTGKWSFNTSQTPPLYISGRTYDVYNAAADALESWAASVALDFDVSTGRSNLTATRSQKQAMLLKVADQYRARGRSSSVSVERSDT